MRMPAEPEDPFSSVEAFRRKLLPKREPVDYREIAGKARALFFGENHDTTAGKKEVFENISLFCKMGFRNFALDAFPGDAQLDVDEYVFRGRNRAGAMNWLADLAPEHAAALEKIVDEVRRVNFEEKAGARIIAVEVTDYMRARYAWEFKRRTAKMRERKEEHMCEAVSGLLRRDRGAKVVALLPSVYAQANHCQGRLEVAAGAEARSIRVIGGKKRAAGAGVFFQRVAENAARAEKLDGERFCIALPKSRKGPFFNYLLHLPQKEEPSHSEKGLLFNAKRRALNALQEAFARIRPQSHEEKF